MIVIPKTLLWLGVTRSGVHYLMETAGIMNVVVNAMALSFILNAPCRKSAAAWAAWVRNCHHDPVQKLTNKNIDLPILIYLNDYLELDEC